MQRIWQHFERLTPHCWWWGLQGLYKSCLVCPNCSHSSVKFDPFMYLSLPLPSAGQRSVTVTLVSTDGGSLPVQYCLQVPKAGTVADLQAALRVAAQLGPDEETVLATISFHRVQTKLQEKQELRLALPCAALCNLIVAYRRPRFPEGTKLREVHVFHRRAALAGSTFSTGSLFAAPLLLWFPCEAEAEEDSLGEVDLKAKHEEELESALAMALRPFGLRRQRTNSTDSASKGSVSDMTDRDPTASATSMCQDSAGDESSSHVAAVTLVDCGSMEPSRSHAEAPGNCSSACTSFEEGTTRQRPEPFDMWASPAEPLAPNGKAGIQQQAGRKRGSPAYQLHPCSEFGTTLSTAWNSFSSSSFGGSKTEYFVIEWESDGGGMYNPSLLENPHQDESVAQAQAQAEGSVSLDSCLECFLQHERLDPQDSWYCPKCKEHVQADKKLDLWSLPEVLVVHLKRFSYTSRLRDKLTAPVEFPLAGLDLSSYVLKEQTVPPVYDLFAVSNHMGSLGGGHYTAYAKQPGTVEWYCFDDSQVYSVTTDQVVSSNAYVLFYQRRHESKQRDQQVLEVLQHPKL